MRALIEENPFHRPGFAFDADLLHDTRSVVIVAAIILLLIVSFWRYQKPSRQGDFRKRSDGIVLPFRKGTPSAIALDQPKFDQSRMHLPEYQLSVIAEATFETQPLLNHSEARLLPVIEAALAEFGRGHRVMAQTSLGELLRPRDDQNAAIRDAAYAAINSKRFDFSIIDRGGRLVAAIEYQGAGHYRNTSFMRDAVKREACRKAGVAFIEVQQGTLSSDLTEQLRKLIAPENTVRTEQKPTL